MIAPRLGPERRTLRVREVAASLGVKEKTVRMWIATGALQAIRVGPRLLLVEPKALDRFLDRHRGPALPRAPDHPPDGA